MCWLALEEVRQFRDPELDQRRAERVAALGAEPARELAEAEQDRRRADRLAVAAGQRADLKVALQEGAEELRGPGFAVVEQEMAQVEIGVGAAHLAEVDDAAVAAGVSVDG